MADTLRTPNGYRSNPHHTPVTRPAEKRLGTWLGVLLSAALLLATLGSARAVPPPQSARIQLTGSFAQGGLLHGQLMPGAQLWLDGKAVFVTRSRQFALGFGRDAAPLHQLRLVTPSGQETHQQIHISARKYNVQRIDGLPPELVHPKGKALLARIIREVALVHRARSWRTEANPFETPFIWPAAGPITGVYGSRRILNGEPKRPHYGLDIAGPRGAPVVAPADGIVRLAQKNLYYSGGTLVIDHGAGIFTTFLHLSQLNVSVGEKIRQGDVIGHIGSSGRATGPHLDWRLNWFNVRLDPIQLMTGKPPEKVIPKESHNDR